MEIITIPEARRIILDAQGLTKTAPFGSGPNSVAKAVDQLSYVQIDTISVVARAHHHVLWTRIPAYKQEWLEKAQYKTRSIFEYWSHAAAYLPMKDYRYSLPVMQVFRNKKDRWPQSSKKDMAEVIRRIRSDGPLMSRDFESDHKGSTWWDWKPSKWALQRLFLEGTLMVSHREGFQRVYDLAERILPAGIDTTMPTETEYYTFLITRTLGAQGIASRNALFHLRKINQVKFDKVLNQLAEEGTIMRLDLAGNKNYYTLPHLPERRIRLQPHIIILSPFDNLVIWRQRLKELFDFDYTLECYIPAHKRQYGYFCLPVLYKDQFLGRVDVKADRKNGVLVVNKMHWHESRDREGFPTHPDEGNMLRSTLDSLLKDALMRFAEFNGCTTVFDPLAP